MGVVAADLSTVQKRRSEAVLVVVGVGLSPLSVFTKSSNDHSSGVYLVPVCVTIPFLGAFGSPSPLMLLKLPAC